MTHEQKPESAEFRTRQAQVVALAFEISDWKSYDDNEDITLARAHIAEAEARGAAAQRRKDAEGVEIAGYRHSAYVEVDDYERKVFSGSSTHNWHEDGEGVVYTTTPLYSRPANVAALEARVKDLEGALSYLKDEALRFADMYPRSSDMRNSFEVFASKIEARATAIREGGERGQLA